MAHLFSALTFTDAANKVLKFKKNMLKMVQRRPKDNTFDEDYQHFKYVPKIKDKKKDLTEKGQDKNQDLTEKVKDKKKDLTEKGQGKNQRKDDGEQS